MISLDDRAKLPKLVRLHLASCVLQVDQLPDTGVDQDVMTTGNARDLEPDGTSEPKAIAERDVVEMPSAHSLEKLLRSHRTKIADDDPGRTFGQSRQSAANGATAGLVTSPFPAATATAPSRAQLLRCDLAIVRTTFKESGLRADSYEMDDLENYVVRGRESLANRRAGQSAREKANELKNEKPARVLMSRVFGWHTDERAWRKGAEGEELLKRWLDPLREQGWHLFHDIPIGSRGANVDHLAIGPGGVFSINMKNLTGKVWIADRAILHNGRKTDFLLKSNHEAQRVAGLLSDALGRAVSVKGVLAIRCDDFTVKSKPADVAVVRAHYCKEWLQTQPALLSKGDVFAIAGKADHPGTWTRGAPRRATRG
jgi:hypothetical protein